MKLFVCMECGWSVEAEEWASTCGNDDCSEWRMVEMTKAFDFLSAAASRYLKSQGRPPKCHEDVDVIMECGIGDE